MPMSERLTLPVLPLREVVLFPGVSTPVGAGRPTTLRAIEAALKSDSRLIFAVAQRENVDTVTPDVLYTTGTITKISQSQRGLGGVQQLHAAEAARERRYCHSRRAVHDRDDHQDQPDPARPRRRAAAAARRAQGYGPPLHG